MTAPDGSAEHKSQVTSSANWVATVVAMSVEQLREESGRLAREHNKLAVQLTVELAAAMQRRFPGTLEQAVEETSKAARIGTDRLWLCLRTDYTTRLHSPEPQGFVRIVETVLDVCGQRGVEIAQITTHLMKMQELGTRRAQVMEAREAARHRDLERERQQAQRERDIQTQREIDARMRAVLEATARREPLAVVPDAPGCDHHKPDPLTASSVAEFVELLGRLHVWAGEVSLRELARRSPEGIAHSTFSAMLNTPAKLPTQRTVRLFVHALGCDEEEVQRWVTAWRTLRFKRRACRQQADNTVTAFRRPASSQ
jgi:hypothetical protein